MEAVTKCLIAMCLAAHTSSFAAVVEDNFDTDSLAGPHWGPVNNRGGQLSVADGALQFIASGQPYNKDNFASVNWNTAPSNLMHDWTFTADLHIADFSYLDTTQAFSLGIQVLGLNATTHSTTNPVGDAYLVTGLRRSIGNSFETMRQCTPVTPCGRTVRLGNTVSLRETYDAATHTLSSEFDPDGDRDSFIHLSSAENFIPTSLGILADSFGVVVLPNDATLDNVQTTLATVVVPEPRVFACLIAGLAVMSLTRRSNKT